MRQLVSTMFISNNGPSFPFWLKENLVKHREVSKYYETDCRNQQEISGWRFLLWFEKLNSRTWQRWRNKRKINKYLANIANKVWQNSNAFEKFKIKMKTYKKPLNCPDLLVQKCNNEIWQERMNAQNRKKSAKSREGNFQRSVCHLWSHKWSNKFLKDNTDILGK